MFKTDSKVIKQIIPENRNPAEDDDSPKGLCTRNRPPTPRINATWQTHMLIPSDKRGRPRQRDPPESFQRVITLLRVSVHKVRALGVQ